jgi:aspartate/methionine/tyrosine aminotransferase
VALAPGRRERLLARTRGIVRANYPLIRRWIGEQDGLSHAAPDAGAIVFVKYAHPVGSVELAERLRTDAGVLVLPGTFFDLDGYLRIGFGADPAYLSSALDRIGDVLRTIGAHAR